MFILTIALTIKVNDGLVLSADSATTMVQYTEDGPSVINIYNNANKVFQLHKELPVGAVTWGLGNIGVSSISTLVKEFRKKITEGDKVIDLKNYTIESIAHLFFEFIYHQKYTAMSTTGSMGFVIGGYSHNSDLPEKWRIYIDDSGQCDGPVLLAPTNTSGAYWDGQPEAINRLVRGYSGTLTTILEHAGIEPLKIQEIIELCAVNIQAPFFSPSMPIQDAIDLADYLIDATIKYVKYTPGHQTVGGPIEIAVITKYEGMKWIKRKHYYNNDVN